jgi:hypothetical protein
VVSTLVRNRPKPSDFSGRKIPQCRFVRGVTKAVGLMLPICDMQKIPTLKWKCPLSAKVHRYIIVDASRVQINKKQLGKTTIYYNKENITKH